MARLDGAGGMVSGPNWEKGCPGAAGRFLSDVSFQPAFTISATYFQFN